MKFATAIAFAAGVAAHASNVTYTTEVVTAYTTYCPGPTEITHGGKTYTITEATTFTITDCPCTVTKPVIATSSVICHDCPAPAPPKGGNNSTIVPVVPTGKPGHGGDEKPGHGGEGEQPGKPGQPQTPGAPAATPTGSAPGEVPTAGAGKVAALSGAGLAAVVGLAAFL